MVKKKKQPSKAVAKANKKTRVAQKVERKEKKQQGKARLEEEEDDQDLEGILDKVLIVMPPIHHQG